MHIVFVKQCVIVFNISRITIILLIKECGNAVVSALASGDRGTGFDLRSESEFFLEPDMLSLHIARDDINTAHRSSRRDVNLSCSVQGNWSIRQNRLPAGNDRILLTEVIVERKERNMKSFKHIPLIFGMYHLHTHIVL